MRDSTRPRARFTHSKVPQLLLLPGDAQATASFQDIRSSAQFQIAAQPPPKAQRKHSRRSRHGFASASVALQESVRSAPAAPVSPKVCPHRRSYGLDCSALPRSLHNHVCMYVCRLYSHIWLCLIFPTSDRMTHGTEDTVCRLSLRLIFDTVVGHLQTYVETTSLSFSGSASILGAVCRASAFRPLLYSVCQVCTYVRTL